MACLLKQSTTVTVRLGPFLDKADGVTEKTAITPVVEVSKNNAAFGARNSGTAITHDSNGWYAVEVNTVDTGTVGPLILKSDDSATYLPVWREFMVVPAETYDTDVTGSDNRTVDLTATAKSDVNAEVVDVIRTDTPTAITAVPAANSSINDRVNFIFQRMAEKTTQTSTTQTLRNRGDSATIGTAATSDDGTTYTRGTYS